MQPFVCLFCPNSFLTNFRVNHLPRVFTRFVSPRWLATKCDKERAKAEINIIYWGKLPSGERNSKPLCFCPIANAWQMIAMNLHGYGLLLAERFFFFVLGEREFSRLTMGIVRWVDRLERIYFPLQVTMSNVTLSLWHPNSHSMTSCCHGRAGLIGCFKHQLIIS